MKTTKTKTVSIKPVAKATRPRELAPIQQLIADEIADLIVHGSHSDAVWHLLTAAGCHSVWRWAVNLWGPDEQKKIDDAVRQRGNASHDLWKSDLIAEWKRNRNATPSDRVQPKTAAERIRARTIDDLRDQFETFLTQGTPEEQMILTDVLMTHASSTHIRDSFDELPLGMAMESALDKYAGEFLRVPYRLEKQVNQYIDCLIAADCKGDIA